MKFTEQIITDFRITKAKFGVMLMTVIVIIASSQLSPLFLSAGVSGSDAKEQTKRNPVHKLSLDEEFTINDAAYDNMKNPNMSSIPASFNSGAMPPGEYDNSATQSADSLIYENDSTFTIEGIKDELSQDGEWIKVSPAEVDPDGVVDNTGGIDKEINTDYVWRPRNVAAGWSPYTNGYWNYTNCGWMWISYYHWGWRPYHYGRWWWSEYYGWVWSPGFVFAPAWVVWMYNDGYCGWYPISPRIRCHNYYGWRCHNMRYRVRHWNFCHKKDFVNPLNPPVVIIDPSHNGGMIKTATYDGVVQVNDEVVTTKGPNVDDIVKTTGVKVTKDDVTKYGTKITITKNVDTRKDDVVQPTKDGGKGNDPVKHNDGGNNDGTKNNETNDGTKNNDGVKNNDDKRQEDKIKEYEKKQQDEKQRDYDKQRENDKRRQEEKDRQQDKQRENDKKKDSEKKKDSYNPPPKEYNPPPKEESPPPTKETYTPPKNDNPPKNDKPPRNDNPPPKRDNPPPKNDDGNKGNDNGSKR